MVGDDDGDDADGVDGDVVDVAVDVDLGVRGLLKGVVLLGKFVVEEEEENDVVVEDADAFWLLALMASGFGTFTFRRR